MAKFLSDADVGIVAPPRFLSDADVGIVAPPRFLSDADVGIEAAPQTMGGAAVNALAQGVVGGVGGMVGGAGDIAKFGERSTAKRVLKYFDLVDEGKKPDAYQRMPFTEQQQIRAYRGASPEGRAALRAAESAALEQKIDNYGTPSMAQRAGAAINKFSTDAFPVDPANEGRTTSVARIVGGVGPAVAVGALGGPTGIAAALASVGAQAFHSTRAEAIAMGATPDEADSAAGKAALVQMPAMFLPLGRVLSRIPVPLRDGFMKTVVKVGLGGVEVGAGNTLGTMAQNYVAQQTYDPGRAVFEATGDAVIDGFLAGLVIHAIPRAGSALSAAASREAATRRATIADIGKAPDIDTAVAVAAQAAAAPAGGASPAQQPGGASATNFGQLFGAGPMGNSAGTHSPTLTMSSGQKVPTRFDVVEARDLIPASGDLQPRDRSGRLASDAQVSQIAAGLDPELLHSSPGPDQGSPTVSSAGVILAGNGRTMAIRQAYAAGNAAAYRAMIERHGFDTTGMTEPVLIRRIDEQMTPEQERKIAVESNIPSGQRLSATEQAAIDARGMSAEMLAKYNPLLTGGPTAAGNRDFVRSWIGTLAESERNSVQDASGNLSSEGVRRLQGAMLGRAYGDKGTLARSLESTDDNTRGLTGALTDAAPLWAQLQAEIAAGRVPKEMDISEQLTRAVELVGQAREKGQSVRDILAQTDAFNPMDPMTEAFIKAFYNPALTRAASRPAVADILRRYAAEAAKQSPEAGLFGDDQPRVTPSDILHTVTTKERLEPTTALETQAAGAQVTNASSLVPYTPAEKKTLLQKMVNQGASDRLTPDRRDDAVYIPGVERPNSMRDFSDAAPGEMSISLAHKVLLFTDSNYKSQYDAIVKKNNYEMVDKLHNFFGDGNSREIAWQAARDLMPGSVGLWKGERAVDAGSVVAGIKRILASPEGKSDDVKLVLKKVERSLYDSDGNLETMPSMLKGVRNNITNKLYDKTPTKEGNAARVARDQLNAVVRLLDSAISPGLPGTAYRDYLSNLSAALGKVEKMDYLQTFLTGPKKLTDGDGNLVLGKVRALLSDIEQNHANKTGGARQLSMSEINFIESVRNELAAKQLLDIRAKVPGSPTAQVASAAGFLGSGTFGVGVKGGAEVLAHMVLAQTTGGIGNAGLLAHRLIVKPMLEARTEQQKAERLAATKAYLLDTTPRPEM